MEKRILEIVVCPLCKGKLHYDRTANELICRFDKLAYPVCCGVPIMVVAAARDLQNSKNNSKNNEVTRKRG